MAFCSFLHCEWKLRRLVQWWPGRWRSWRLTLNLADTREGNLDATGLAQWFTAKVTVCPRDPWKCLETLLGSQLERRFYRFLVGGAKEGAHHSVVHGAAHTAKSDLVPKVSCDEGRKLAEESWTKQTSTRSGKMNGFITNTIYVWLLLSFWQRYQKISS